MKTRSNWELTSFAQLRTPLFSFQKITKLSWNNINLIKKQIVKDEYFLLAIHLSSPEFYSALCQWLEKEEEQNIDESILITIYKYYARMCYRSSPFGVFAGVSNISIDESETKGVLSTPKFFGDIDVDVYSEMIRSFNNSYNIKLCKNPHIFCNNKKIRIYTLSGLVSFEMTHELAEILIKSENGCSVDDVFSILDKHDFNQRDQIEYLKELLENGILINELSPLISRKSYIRSIIDFCESQQYHELQVSYEIIENSIKRLSNNILTELEKRLRSIDKQGGTTLLNIQTHFTDSTLKINAEVVEEIKNEIEEIFKHILSAESSEVKEFRDEFKKRYGEIMVPLTSVLDIETGIPFGNNISVTSGQNILRDIVGEIHDKSLPKKNGEKKIEYRLSRANEIEIISNPPEFEEEEESNPSSFFILGSLFSSVEPSSFKKNGYSFYVKNIGGSSAINLMTRFLTFDTKLKSALREIVRFEKENNSQKIIAEILYMPEGKGGNVAQWSRLHKYVIPIGATTNDNRFTKIHLEDILVYVDGCESIRLYSKKLKKEIIPVLNNAHNYKIDFNPMYDFLSSLQKKYSFSPELYYSLNIRRQSSYMPRVKYKHLILSRANWQFRTHKEFELAKHNLPKFLVIQEGENDLVLDLDVLWCQKIIRKQFLKGADYIILYELLDHENNCWVMDKHGHGHTSEIIIPVLNHLPQTIYTEKKANIEAVAENYHLGSEWLYVKIYGNYLLLSNGIIGR